MFLVIANRTNLKLFFFLFLVIANRTNLKLFFFAFKEIKISK